MSESSLKLIADLKLTLVALRFSIARMAMHNQLLISQSLNCLV